MENLLYFHRGKSEMDYKNFKVEIYLEIWYIAAGFIDESRDGAPIN